MINQQVTHQAKTLEDKNKTKTPWFFQTPLTSVCIKTYLETKSLLYIDFSLT